MLIKYGVFFMKKQSKFYLNLLFCLTLTLNAALAGKTGKEEKEEGNFEHLTSRQVETHIVNLSEEVKSEHIQYLLGNIDRETMPRVLANVYDKLPKDEEGKKNFIKTLEQCRSVNNPDTLLSKNIIDAVNDMVSGNANSFQKGSGGIRHTYLSQATIQKELDEKFNIGLGVIEVLLGGHQGKK